MNVRQSLEQLKQPWPIFEVGVSTRKLSLLLTVTMAHASWSARSRLKIRTSESSDMRSAAGKDGVCARRSASRVGAFSVTRTPTTRYRWMNTTRSHIGSGKATRSSSVLEVWNNLRLRGISLGIGASDPEVFSIF